VSVLDDAQWRALVDVTGPPPGVDGGSLAARPAAHDAIDAYIAAWAAGRDLPAALDELVVAGVPAAPVTDPRRTAEHPQFLARGDREAPEHPVVGAHPVPTVPFRFASVDRWVRSPAPTLGQHNDEVIGGWLVRTPAQLASLREAGVTGTRPAL
jgi:crotonobetainyl-CoA:carnitine CoA-transferase CaiB-like acyl-CoA transferase